VFKGKTVALVGNGPVTRRDGRVVDSCDVVIRCNYYKVNSSRGWRTTHHALNASTLGDVRCAIRGKDALRIACVTLDKSHMSPDGKADIWLPQDWLESFTHRMKPRPTIGCMLTHWLLERCDPYYVVMTGFSWSSKGVRGQHNLEEEHVLFKSADTGHVILL